MYKVTINEAKNRLYITLVDEISYSEGQEIYSSILRALNKLKPRFDVVTDLRKYKCGSKKAYSIIGNIMEHLNKRSIRQAVRVIGNSKTALLDFASNSPQIDGYNVTYVPNMEDAEKLLENLNRP